MSAFIRGKQHEAVDTITLPSTHALELSPSMLEFCGGDTTRKVAYLQFLPRLLDGDTLISATLRLTASAAWTGTPGTHTIRALDFWGDALAIQVTTAAEIESLEVESAEWEADQVVEYDVTAVVAAALAHASYERGSPITLSIETEETTARLFKASASDPLSAASLAIEFTPDGTDADLPPELQVMLGLWQLLEGHRDVTAIFKPGNRIKFLGTNRDPHKEQIATADVPEIRIVPWPGGTLAPIRTTDSSSGTLMFSVQVATGDKRVDADGAGLHYAKWSVFRALADWRELLAALKWRGLPFVQKLSLTSVQDGAAQSDLDRGIKGWSSLWTVSVDVWFRTIDVIK